MKSKDLFFILFLKVFLMTKIANEIIHMTCGCELYRSDLKYIFNSPVCPIHPESGQIKKIEKYCSACGAQFFVNKMAFVRNLCKDCMAKTKRHQSYHAVHPFLIPKTSEECIEDIIINQTLGFNEIQIDPSIEIPCLTDPAPIQIDLYKKIKDLKKEKI